MTILAKNYVEKTLRAEYKRFADRITLVTFNMLIMRSCLIDELKQRLIAKPGKEWTFSVFQGRAIKKTDAELKKLIYCNLRMFKPVKHVQWKGLPPIEEDELRQSKKKMMKDIM